LHFPVDGDLVPLVVIKPHFVGLDLQLQTSISKVHCEGDAAVLQCQV